MRKRKIFAPPLKTSQNCAFICQKNSLATNELKRNKLGLVKYNSLTEDVYTSNIPKNEETDIPIIKFSQQDVTIENEKSFLGDMDPTDKRSLLRSEKVCEIYKSEVFDGATNDPINIDSFVAKSADQVDGDFSIQGKFKLEFSSFSSSDDNEKRFELPSSVEIKTKVDDGNTINKPLSDMPLEYVMNSCLNYHEQPLRSYAIAEYQIIHTSSAEPALKCNESECQGDTPHKDALASADSFSKINAVEQFRCFSENGRESSCLSELDIGDYRGIHNNLEETDENDQNDTIFGVQENINHSFPTHHFDDQDKVWLVRCQSGGEILDEDSQGPQCRKDYFITGNLWHDCDKHKAQNNGAPKHNLRKDSVNKDNDGIKISCNERKILESEGILQGVIRMEESDELRIPQDSGVFRDCLNHLVPSPVEMLGYDFQPMHDSDTKCFGRGYHGDNSPEKLAYQDRWYLHNKLNFSFPESHDDNGSQGFGLLDLEYSEVSNFQRVGIINAEGGRTSDSGKHFIGNKEGDTYKSASQISSTHLRSSLKDTMQEEKTRSSKWDKFVDYGAEIHSLGVDHLVPL